MSPSLYKPKLRSPIELRVERFEGQEALLINCPLGVSDKPLFLNPALGPIIIALNGEATLSEITTRYHDYGLTSSLLNELVTLLDSHLFLEGARFNHARDQLLRSYRELTVRAPALAGLSYPVDPSALRSLVDGHLHAQVALPPPSGELSVLMAPHIDYRRGGTCYGVTYNYLKDTHDILILIGTSHQYSHHLFHLTRKHFDSPLGTAECATEFVDQLAHAYGPLRSYADEVLHRREHSLELQIPFLKCASNAKIVPILVGSFHHMLTSGKKPSDFEEYESFVCALTSVWNAWKSAGKRIAVVAGVDMAHIGRQFGDKFELSTALMDEVRQRDHHYLTALETQDKLALFGHVAEDEDQRRICGFPTMYTIIDILDRLGITTSAKLFDYQQAVDAPRGCAVTFAGMGMYMR